VAPVVQPNSLIFIGTIGDSSPSSQNVVVYDPTGTDSAASGERLGGGNVPGDFDAAILRRAAEPGSDSVHRDTGGECAIGRVRPREGGQLGLRTGIAVSVAGDVGAGVQRAGGISASLGGAGSG
jgi:hypothetical protein